MVHRRAPRCAARQPRTAHGCGTAAATPTASAPPPTATPADGSRRFWRSATATTRQCVAGTCTTSTARSATATRSRAAFRQWLRAPLRNPRVAQPRLVHRVLVPALQPVGRDPAAAPHPVPATTPPTPWTSSGSCPTRCSSATASSATSYTLPGPGTRSRRTSCFRRGTTSSSGAGATSWTSCRWTTTSTPSAPDGETHAAYGGDLTRSWAPATPGCSWSRPPASSRCMASAGEQRAGPDAPQLPLLRGPRIPRARCSSNGEPPPQAQRPGTPASCRTSGDSPAASREHRELGAPWRGSPRSRPRRQDGRVVEADVAILWHAEGWWALENPFLPSRAAQLLRCRAVHPPRALAAGPCGRLRATR